MSGARDPVEKYMQKHKVVGQDLCKKGKLLQLTSYSQAAAPRVSSSSLDKSLVLVVAQGSALIRAHFALWRASVVYCSRSHLS